MTRECTVLAGCVRCVWQEGCTPPQQPLPRSQNCRHADRRSLMPTASFGTGARSRAHTVCLALQMACARGALAPGLRGAQLVARLDRPQVRPS